jgi:hypothetical protein
MVVQDTGKSKYTYARGHDSKKCQHSCDEQGAHVQIRSMVEYEKRELCRMFVENRINHIMKGQHHTVYTSPDPCSIGRY